MEERLNARLDGVETRMTPGLKEVKSELSLIGRKIEAPANSKQLFYSFAIGGGGASSPDD
jgi:hypothetical protein